MSIEIDAKCDAKGCGMRLRDGDEAYCADCYSELEKRIEQLEAELRELQKEP